MERQKERFERWAGTWAGTAAHPLKAGTLQNQPDVRSRPWLRENAESAMIPLAICSGGWMKRYIEGADQGRWTLLPECLDDWIGEDNPVRAIDAFVDALDLAELGFKIGEEMKKLEATVHGSLWAQFSAAGVPTLQ